MTISHRSAPLQADLKERIKRLLTSRADEVPEDGYDRVDYRLELILAAYDDDDPGDPTQPYRDLLTDVLHHCAREGWPTHELIARADWMRTQESANWDGIDEENRRLEG